MGVAFKIRNFIVCKNQRCVRRNHLHPRVGVPDRRRSLGWFESVEPTDKREPLLSNILGCVLPLPFGLPLPSERPVFGGLVKLLRCAGKGEPR